MKKNNLARKIVDEAGKKNIFITTCESCTGGLLSSKIVKESGASKIFDRAFITYSNFAKNEMLDVSLDSIYKNGAVSEEVAHKMALNGLKRSKSQIAISITGLAGPLGETKDKQIGLVYFGLASRKNEKSKIEVKIFKKIFQGKKNEYSRNQIQNLTANFALKILLKEVLDFESQ